MCFFESSRKILKGSRTKALVGDGVALFEPLFYNPANHTPSPIFLNELKPVDPLPRGWRLRPRFMIGLVETIAWIDTGDADLYGAGEVRGNLRRNNDRQYFWNTENPTGFLFNGKKLYQSHPWLLGVRKDGSAFGIIADTTWESELNTRIGVLFRSKGPLFRIVIIEKENPAQVMRTLAELTGKMTLPPLWALGYQQCRYSYFPQEHVAGIANAFRHRRIPCDVLWMDIHYMDKFRIFTFDPEGFSKPEALNEHLHKNNFKAVYMIDPGVKAEEGYFVDDQGREGDYFVRKKNGELFHGPVWAGDSHFPDFSNPDACKWWAGLYKDFMAKGVDGVWNDMNEPSVFVNFGGTIKKSARHKGGGDMPSASHRRYHNIYGYMMVRASLEGIKAANPDKRPFVLSRSNFLGGHRYAAMWTGDNFSDYSQMKESVPMCLNISLSGQPFNGPDIGGFLRDCTPDLLRHWTASGIYFPFARNHTMFKTLSQEPWAFDSQTEDICRTSIERRYRLLPYYYTLFEEASRCGLPIMRPVYWADFKDLSLRAEQQAFMIGDSLLVIPRWCENPALPRGGWKLFSFEDKDDGYQSYLAIRPGAAIPVYDVIQSTAEYDPAQVTVLVNPDADGRAHGCMYDDAGEGYGYEKGEYARLEFDALVENGKVVLEIKHTDGHLERQRRTRIAVIKDGALQYSQWNKGSRASMEPIPSAQSLDDAKLDFVHVEDFSVGKGYTKMELIMTKILDL